MERVHFKQKKIIVEDKRFQRKNTHFEVSTKVKYQQHQNQKNQRLYCMIFLPLILLLAKQIYHPAINIGNRKSFFGTIVAKKHHSFTCSRSMALNDEMDILLHKFNIRTITLFIKIDVTDFETTNTLSRFEKQKMIKSKLEAKIEACANYAYNLKSHFEDFNYTVQTVRIATNPFEEYLCNPNESFDVNDVSSRLSEFDAILNKYDIQFCSLGPSNDPENICNLCPLIVQSSPRFSCSANVGANDIKAAQAASECVIKISKLGNGNQSHLDGGLGNFRFCSASSCSDFIPFFPGAKCESFSNVEKLLLQDSENIGFALGFENGELVYDLLSQCQSVSNIPTMFKDGMIKALKPIEQICETFTNEDSSPSNTFSYTYLGMDTSLNPSLSEHGSVAKAIETLAEVKSNFGGQGTLAAAAAITTTLQSLPLKMIGYCGLMLPVCEDVRLSELGKTEDLKITQLLCISSVCGVGVDTVPLSGTVSEDQIQSLMLDIAALAGRWNKSLSCRVFPIPKLKVGDKTDFDSPYLCNSRTFDLS